MPSGLNGDDEKQTILTVLIVTDNICVNLYEDGGKVVPHVAIYIEIKFTLIFRFLQTKQS